MDFEEFKEKIKGEMERRLKGGKAVVREVIKNNSVRRTGIFLEAPGEGACPVIYLEGPYERLCRGQEFAEVSGEVWLGAA